LLAYETTIGVLAKLAGGLTPEMVAAVSKICRNQDLILICAEVSGDNAISQYDWLARLFECAPSAESSNR